MANLLYLRASLFADNGNSSRLAAAFIERWQAAHPDGKVTLRDLTGSPLPHLDAERVSAFFAPAAERNAAQQAVIAESDVLINELRQADHIVIGLPMYNFGIPSQLKAWIDQVARAGETFRYTENGPVGLLDNTPVTVLAARGGQYADTGNDHQVPYLRQFLGFIGLSEVRFVFAEGMNMSEHKEQALQRALAEVAELAL